MKPLPNPDASPMERLLEVMARLRGEGGCPWDREQDHRSLLPYLIEEAYELIEAVEEGSSAEIREELGDVLLQVVFHSRIAEERGEFSFQEVAAGLAEKLVSRHPHVFGGEPLETAGEVHRSWQARKRESRRSALEGVPSGQPALQWAAQVGSRAADAGFEWEATAEALAKAREELQEVEQAAAEGAEPDALEAEWGDFLFAMAQVARRWRIDPELALRRATRKFIARFGRMEEALRERGADPATLDAGAWRSLWAEIKRETAN